MVLCSGLHQPPLPGTIQLQPSTHTTAAPASVAPDQGSYPTRQLPCVPVSIATVVCYLRCRNSGILKRIPKGARLAATNLLSKLIHDILQHPLYTSSWSKILGFPSACLVKPLQGGKSRNLTTQIVKQIYEYDHGVVEPPPELLGFRPSRRTIPPKKKSHDEAIAMLTSVKLEDGDVNGAVRLLCSDDRLASPDETTFDELRRLHLRGGPNLDCGVQTTEFIKRSLFHIVGRSLLRMSHRFKFHLQRSVRLSSHSQ